jgi:hypothetical protein
VTANRENDLLRATKKLGPAAVPYLVEQLKREPVREALHTAGRKAPGLSQFILTDVQSYRRRRMVTAWVLATVDCDVSAALPVALEIVNFPEDPAFVHCVMLLAKAHGTQYEEEAVRGLIRVSTFKLSSRNQFAKRMVYEALPKFSGHPELVIPALVNSLQEPGGFQRINTVASFETNAIPYLLPMIEKETNHVRPATIALERIMKMSWRTRVPDGILK